MVTAVSCSVIMDFWTPGGLREKLAAADIEGDIANLFPNKSRCDLEPYSASACF
jgi:hypothetical protein